MSQTNPLKYLIKRGIQHLAASLGPQIRNPSDPRLLLLMYHRILPGEDTRTQREEPGMVVTPETFRNNLNILSQYFEFIRLSEWIERNSKNLALPPKACAVTFDDGWGDNYEFAFPILEELGIPATIFLVSDMIGTRNMFWPERLARMVIAISREHSQQWSNESLGWLRTSDTSFGYSDTEPSTEEISQLVAYAKRLPDDEIHGRLNAIESELSIGISAEKPPLLDWEQVNEMATSGLVEMGSHTRHHTRLLAKTPQRVIEDEILKSKTNIEIHTGCPVKTFCFPNGDYTTESLQLVRKHYTGAVTTRSGWNKARDDNYLLNRIGIHEDIARDKTAFLARISGWL